MFTMFETPKEKARTSRAFPDTSSKRAR